MPKAQPTDQPQKPPKGGYVVIGHPLNGVDIGLSEGTRIALLETGTGSTIDVDLTADEYAAAQAHLVLE
jgi:hypothetical protein